MSHSSSRSLRVSRFLLTNQVDRGSSPTNGATMALMGELASRSFPTCSLQSYVATSSK